LTTAEFDLLCVLARNAGSVMPRERLIAATAHRSCNPMDRTVDTLIRRLRRKIEHDSENPTIITTVHGAGYMFVA
jgi:DNA-binding response OmpR family regulator